MNRRVKTAHRIAQVVEVILSAVDEWPLTVRQVFYRLVAQLTIVNRLNAYKRCSDDIASARQEDLIPWESIEDRHRFFTSWAVWPNASAYVRTQTQELLATYSRDYLADQPHMVELWIEKSAIATQCKEVASEFCVPVVEARGFASVTFKHELVKRTRAANEAGKGMIILYLGDLDPSGVSMPESIEEFVLEAGCANWRLVRIGLNPDQVRRFNLPKSVEPLKRGDSRRRKFVERYGDTGYEVDALPTAARNEIIREAILANLDALALRESQRLESEERETLAAQREAVLPLLCGRGGAA